MHFSKQAHPGATGRAPAHSALRSAIALGPLVLALGGCAYAPGLYLEQDQASDGKAPRRTTLVTMLRESAAAEAPTAAQPRANAATADLPPPGAITPITPALVQQLSAARNDDIAPEVRALFAAPRPYTIGPGDVLNIVVWDHPELQIVPAGAVGAAGGESIAQSTVGNGYNVSPDGLVQFPHVGKIRLAGLTEYQARDLLTQRLARVIKDPQVTVRIQSYRSGRVYLDGEVRAPGLQAVNDVPLTLPEALGRAGGLTAQADRSAITITRAGRTTRVSLPQLTERGINPNDILLGPGDLVRVPARDESKVFVLGEVSRPSSLTLRNGSLTLNEALGEAGGVNPGSGNPRQIYVVRAGASPTQPAIYHLDAGTPVAYALAEGFELKTRDVVYVDPVPLVRWNRVISLILPSAQAVTTTRSAMGQ